MAGAEDRVIPHWVQRKLCAIFPHTRFELIEDSGHVVYLEKSELFFQNLRAFANAKSLAFPASEAVKE
jgi:pimeloyl-ACP methyl ester carboxylesterase